MAEKGHARSPAGRYPDVLLQFLSISRQPNPAVSCGNSEEPAVECIEAVGQGWDQNPWRPNVSAGLHESRLSWSFDYDLRRTLFPARVRPGDRRFHGYARPHAGW